MSRHLAELARTATPMGDIVLRRRLEPTLPTDVFEVVLGQVFAAAQAHVVTLANVLIDADPASTIDARHDADVLTSRARPQPSTRLQSSLNEMLS